MPLPTATDMRTMIDACREAVEGSKIGPMFEEDELGQLTARPVAMNVFMTLIGQGAYILHHPNCHTAKE